MKRIIATLVTIVTFGCTLHALCGEVHDAAADGNLERIKSLLKEKPDLNGA